MRKFTTCLLTLGVLWFTNGCQLTKEVELGPINSQLTAKAVELQHWFVSEVQNRTTSASVFERAVDWSRGQAQPMKGGQVGWLFPISHGRTKPAAMIKEGEATIQDDGKSTPDFKDYLAKEFLLVLEPTAKSKHAYLVQVVPTRQFRSTNTRLTNQFSGSIFFLEWSETFVVGYKYEQGKILGSYRDPKNARITFQQCTPVHIQWQEVTCVSCGNSCIDCTYILHNAYTNLCYNSDGGSPSGGGPSTLSFEGTPSGDLDPNDPNLGYQGPNDPVAAIASSTTNFNVSQTKQLRLGLNKIIEKCINKFIFYDLVNKNVKINFKISASITTPAQFNAANDDITFKTSSIMQDTPAFTEELYHAYQKYYYPNGIGQYSYGNPGFSNIEFEAKLLENIVSIISTNQTFRPAVPTDEYMNWLIEITNSGTTSPKLFDDFKGNYFYFLEQFKIYNSAYNFPTISTLYPNALLNATINSHCN